MSLQRAVPVAATLLLAALVSGCSAGDDEASALTAPSPSTSTAGPAPAPAPATPMPTPPVIEFSSSGTGTVPCTRFVRYVEFDEIVADQAVDLATLDATTTGGARLTGAWVSDDVPELSTGGSYALGAKGSRISDQPGWATKEPVAGYRLEADATYVVFARYTLPRQASSISGFTVSYTTDDGTEGSALWDISMAREPACP